MCAARIRPRCRSRAWSCSVPELLETVGPLLEAGCALGGTLGVPRVGGAQELPASWCLGPVSGRCGPACGLCPWPSCPLRAPAAPVTRSVHRCHPACPWKPRGRGPGPRGGSAPAGRPHLQRQGMRARPGDGEQSFHPSRAFSARLLRPLSPGARLPFSLANETEHPARVFISGGTLPAAPGRGRVCRSSSHPQETGGSRGVGSRAESVYQLCLRLKGLISQALNCSLI